eukprot:6191850-Pleurochrysis_carterae.AAC.2
MPRTVLALRRSIRWRQGRAGVSRENFHCYRESICWALVEQLAFTAHAFTAHAHADAQAGEHHALSPSHPSRASIHMRLGCSSVEDVAHARLIESRACERV